MDPFHDKINGPESQEFPLVPNRLSREELREFIQLQIDITLLNRTYNKT